MEFPDPSLPVENFQNCWYYKGEPVDVPFGESIGFVYCITNTISGKQYIGKKGSRTKRTKQKTVTLKNGTKKKKKFVEYKESDWKSYFGSNKVIQEDVKELGEEKFFREILVWCDSLGQMSYAETMYQFRYDVLFHPDKFYNGWLCCRVSSSHIKGWLDTEETIE